MSEEKICFYCNKIISTYCGKWNGKDIHRECFGNLTCALAQYNWKRQHSSWDSTDYPLLNSIPLDKFSEDDFIAYVLQIRNGFISVIPKLIINTT